MSTRRRARWVAVFLGLWVAGGCGGPAGQPAGPGEVTVLAYTPAEPKAPDGRPQYVCRRAKVPVKVDGDLSEWADVPAIVLDQPKQAHRDWKGPDDLSGRVRLSYDGDYLYLAFDTTDDVFSHTYPRIPIWAGDCVQLAFDPLEDRSADRHAPDDQEFNLALTEAGPVLECWTGPRGHGRVEGAKLGVVRKKTGGGVVYEVAIPWDDLAPLAPALRRAFGFTFTFNDSDGEPNKGWLEWTAGIQDGKDPSSFGQVVLEYAPPADGTPELYLSSEVREVPNVESLTFPICRSTGKDEKLRVEIELRGDGKTAARTGVDIPLKPGVSTRAVLWTPADLPDGSYTGVITVTGERGRPLMQDFTYERMITAPLAARRRTLQGKITQLSRRHGELYARHEAGLAYRMDVAELWLAGASTVSNWRNLPKLLDETEKAVDTMLRGDDGFARQRGTLLLAYRAPEDDMPQPYRLTVPPDYDGSKPYPLVVLLHGYGGTGLTYDLWYALTVRAGESDRGPRPGYLVAVPYGRGNTGWGGWGRNDVFHVIDAVKHAYKVDEDRIALTGFSMGGSGCWYLSTRYPDRWSAAGPQAGGLGRYDPLKSEEADDWSRQLSAAGSQMLVLENLLNLPTVIYHGIADETVAYNHTEEAYKRLRELTYDTVLVSSVRGGHGSVSQGLRDGITDWLLEHTRAKAPKVVRYATYDLRHNRPYWVEIDELTRDYHPAQVTAKVVEPGKVELRTTNVSRLTLTLPVELRGESGSVAITANGCEVRPAEPSADGTVHLMSADGGTTWTVSAARYRDGLIKRHGMSGPIGEAFADRFILVYGTAGDDAADGINRSEAETFARDLKGLTWGKIWGNFIIRPDTELSEEDIHSANLVLFGGPDINTCTRKIAEGLPLRRVDGKLVFRGKTYDDPGTAVKFVYPNPANPERYVVVTWGATPEAIRNVAQFASPQPDWLVFDAESARRRAENKRPAYADAGFFDRDWK